MIARKVTDIEQILKSKSVAKRYWLLFTGIAASACVIAVLWGTGLILSFIAKRFMK